MDVLIVQGEIPSTSSGNDFLIRLSRSKVAELSRSTGNDPSTGSGNEV